MLYFCIQTRIWSLPFANTVLYVFSLEILAHCLLTGSRKKKRKTQTNVLLWCVFDICIVSRVGIFLSPLFLLSENKKVSKKAFFSVYGLEILINEIKTLSTLSISVIDVQFF